AEGDATLAMLDVARVAAGLPVGGEIPPELLRLESVALQAAPELRGIPGLILRGIVAPYADGLAFVSEVRRRAGGWHGVDAVWRDRPLSTEHILHPDKYFAREPVEPVPPIEAPAGFSEAVYRDVFGEQGLRLLFEEWAPASAAASAASDWAATASRCSSRATSGSCSFTWCSTTRRRLVVQPCCSRVERSARSSRSPRRPSRGRSRRPQRPRARCAEGDSARSESGVARLRWLYRAATSALPWGRTCERPTRTAATERVHRHRRSPSESFANDDGVSSPVARCRRQRGLGIPREALRFSTGANHEERGHEHCFVKSEPAGVTRHTSHAFSRSDESEDHAPFGVSTSVARSGQRRGIG